MGNSETESLLVILSVMEASVPPLTVVKQEAKKQDQGRARDASVLMD